MLDFKKVWYCTLGNIQDTKFSRMAYFEANKFLMMATWLPQETIIYYCSISANLLYQRGYLIQEAKGTTESQSLYLRLNE